MYTMCVLYMKCMHVYGVCTVYMLCTYLYGVRMVHVYYVSMDVCGHACCA